MTDPVDKKLSEIVADEPILCGHAAVYLVASLGEFLAGHTHLVSAAQWSGVSTFLVALVTTVLLALSAVLMRRVVTPAAKLAKRAELKAHELLDGYVAVGSHAVITTPAPATSTTDAVVAALGPAVS